MEKLKNYLKLLSSSEKANFERILKENMGKNLTIKQIRSRITKKIYFNAKVCSYIEIATNGAVTRKDLRPDDWREIWIELAEKEDAEQSNKNLQ